MSDRLCTPAVPFNLEAVVKTHGWFQLAPFYWQEREKTLNWVMRPDDKVRCVSLVQADRKSVKMSCPGLSEREWKIVAAKFHHVFNLGLDLSPFYRQCAADPVLRLLRRKGLGRIQRSESVYEDVFKSICGTNTLWKQAVRMVGAVAELGDRAPLVPFRTFPTPETVLEAGKRYLVEKGRVGYRADSLIALCERAARGDAEAERVQNGEVRGAELLTFFVGYRGIGKITARYLAALYGYFGELAVDSAVIAYMAKTHFGGRRPTEKEVQDHYGRFGEWRYLAYWMEFVLNRGWVPEV